MCMQDWHFHSLTNMESANRMRLVHEHSAEKITYFPKSLGVECK